MSQQVAFCSIGEFHGFNNLVGHFTDVVGVAEASIHQMYTKFSHTLVPGWLEECHKASRGHKHALQTSRDHPSENCITFLHSWPIVQWAVKEAKCLSWINMSPP